MHIDRMSKLLALASSPNDQEALAALRSLKRLLTADEMDFVDLANLVRDNARAVELESHLEATRQQLRQAQLALRTARSGNQDNQVVRDLRQQVRKLTAENMTLKDDLNACSGELDELQAAHNVLDTTLRQSSQERLHLRSKLRQKQIEMDQFVVEVRGMINVTSRLRNFVDAKSPSA